MSDADAMEVDVVIPVRDGARYIACCLDSVIAQTRPVGAAIVVDDGSTDGTAAIVEAYMGRLPGLVLVRTEKCGPAHARNIGVARCKAPFVTFLDSDDVWQPTKLERQMALFAATGPRVGFVHCSYYHIDESGRRLAGCGIIEPQKRIDLFRSLLLEGNIVSGSGSAVVVRRELLEQVGGFDERLTYGEDWDLWLRLAEICELDFVPEPLVAIRIHRRSMQHREVAHSEELSFLKTLLILDRWYGTRKFPPEARKQYRQTFVYMAIKRLNAGIFSGSRDTSKLLSELKNCNSRFGRELFSGPSDVVLGICLTRASQVFRLLMSWFESGPKDMRSRPSDVGRGG